jgi:hypothetical protein
MKTFFLVLSTALLLCACGEKPQSMGGAHRDAPPFEGTGVAAFTVPGWKVGDRTGWELALRARTQYGQNEYSRTN